MANVAIARNSSIVHQLEDLHERVARRAYELFRDRDGAGDALGDWLAAERELVSMPAVELREKDGAFTITAALPGVDAKDIAVDVSPSELVIRAKSERQQREGNDQAYRLASTAQQIFRSLSFPQVVDAAKVKADYDNGMLRITAPVAGLTRTKRGHVTAA